MFIGCAPGCAWCECGADQRMATAWSENNRPKTWAEADQLLRGTCKRPFPSLFQIRESAHLAMPWEKMPRKCRFCGVLPYKDEAEYKLDLSCYADKRADTSKEGIAAFPRERSAHAGKHGGQYKHEAPNLMVGMSDVYPEIMHLDQLNVAKQQWTKGPMRLMSAHMRAVAAGFFKGMGFKLDCKLKSDGRSGTAWFKASQWNEACRGSQKLPGGLAAWMSSLLFYIGEDFLDKQASITPLRCRAGASAEEVLRAHAMAQRGKRSSTWRECTTATWRGITQTIWTHPAMQPRPA